MTKAYFKIVVGYVIQEFVNGKGVSQAFSPVEDQEVIRRNDAGEVEDADTSGEDEFPPFMIQPLTSARN